MIYQCVDCKKLFDEDDGAIVIDMNMSPFPMPVALDLPVFKCKGCIGVKGSKKIDEIQKIKRDK